MNILIKQLKKVLLIFPICLGFLMGISTSNAQESQNYIQYDGTGYVEFGDDARFDFGLKDFTISLWVKILVEDNKEYMVFSSIGDDSIMYMEIYERKIGFSLGNNYFQHSDLVADGEWHNVAVSVDRDTSVTLYVDGAGESHGLSDTADLKFFKTFFGKYAMGGYYWKGDMKDIRIFDRALSAQEIANINSGGSITNNLMGMWNKSKGIELLDSKGAGNGRFNGAEWIGDMSGENPKKYLEFNGTSFVDFGSDSGFDPRTGDFSISVWVKTVLTDDGEHMIISGYGDKAVYLEMYQKKIGFAAGDTYYQHSKEIADGEWHFVVAVMDRDAGINLYVDGTGESGGSPETSDIQFLSNLVLGRYSNGGYYLEGDITNVKMYNRVLTNVEVNNLYLKTEPVVGGLVANWSSFRNGAVIDDAGGFTGVLRGASWVGGVTPELPKKYLSFGNGNYVSFGSDASLDPGTSDFSISAWIKTVVNDDGEYMIISGNGDKYVYMEMYQKKLGFSVGDSYYQNSKIIADGEWHHVVGVMDRDNGMTLYVDGEGEKGGKPETSDIEFLSDLFLGKYSGGGYYWIGDITDVKMYNRVLSAEDVNNLYLKTEPVLDGIITSWSASRSGELLDTMSGHNGVINGATWVGRLSPVFPGAYLYFGGNAYVSLANNNNFSPGVNDFSVSVWVRSNSADNGEHMIFSIQGDTPIYMEMYDNQVGVSIGDTYFKNNEIIGDGEWHHIVAVVDRSSGMTIYVDEKPQTVLAPNLADLQFDGELFLGKYFNDPGYFWNGAITNFKIYDRAITADDVSDLYEGRNVDNGLAFQWVDPVTTPTGTSYGAGWIRENEYYSDAPKAIKREYGANLGGIMECINEEVDGFSNGRMSLVAGAVGNNVYQTYDWDSENVVVTEYDGSYYPIYGSPNRSDVNQAERTYKIVYKHNNSMMNIDATQNGWNLLSRSKYSDDGAIIAEEVTFYESGRLKTWEILNNVSEDEFNEKHIKYHYLDEFLEGGNGRIYRVDNITDNWYYDITYTDPNNPLNNEIANQVKRDLSTGEAIVESQGMSIDYYEGSGLIKRIFYPNGDISEYMDEIYGVLPYGRILLLYDHDNSQYRTYDWGDEDVTVSLYGGNYTVNAGDVVFDGVYSTQLTEVDIFAHNGEMSNPCIETNGWKIKSVYFYGEQGSLMMGLVYYLSGRARIVERENDETNEEFLNKHVKYYYTDENLGNGYGRLTRVDNLTDNWYYEYNYQDPLDPQNTALTSKVIKDIITDETVYWVEYYSDTGLLKRSWQKTEAGTVMTEYLNENFDYGADKLLGYGRITLYAGKEGDSSSYSTYDWNDDTIELTYYAGEYTSTLGDDADSDVKLSERTVRYLYNHNGEMVNTNTSTNGWKFLGMTYYLEDGATPERTFSYYEGSGRLYTSEIYNHLDPNGNGTFNENPDDTTHEFYGKDVKYYYKDEDSGVGYGRMYRIDNITDNWYYDITYVHPDDPNDSTMLDVTKRGMALGEEIVENNGYIYDYYEDSKYVRRGISPDKQIIEYLDENYKNEKYGRVALIYDPSYVVYRTFDWTSNDVTMTIYSGDYTVSSGANIKSGVYTTDKREAYIFAHHGEERNLDTGTNGWNLLERIFFENDGVTISQKYFFYESGRLSKVEIFNDLSEGEFYGKHVKYYLNDEGELNSSGRISRIDNITDNWYYYFTYIDPNDPVSYYHASVEKRSLANDAMITKETYYTDTHLLDEKESASLDAYGNIYYEYENNNFYGNGQYGRVKRIQDAVTGYVTTIMSWFDNTDRAKKEEEFTSRNETTWVITRWYYSSGRLKKYVHNTGEAVLYFDEAGNKVQTFWNADGSITHWNSAAGYTINQTGWYLEKTGTTLEVYTYWSNGNMKFVDIYEKVSDVWTWQTAAGYLESSNGAWDAWKTRAQTGASNTFTLPDKPARTNLESLENDLPLIDTLSLGTVDSST
ncbi:Concanavalin A-like lectin/glucanase [Candidatus Omnitrophus magneticus]|uniref:Concanavalin A-like lectin/glucanase n=1 Tax=Candidatus Omnitrophus magneticus TaxID=1609969 RepID=A0A0F0CNI2_9BACT|nr:Concanavalin A-like lectin/glucanase [Candidatus Omnitrophus magneticus]